MARARYGVTAPSSSGWATTTNMSILYRSSGPLTFCGSCAAANDANAPAHNKSSTPTIRLIPSPRQVLFLIPQNSSRASLRCKESDIFRRYTRHVKFATLFLAILLLSGNCLGQAGSIAGKAEKPQPGQLTERVV